MKTLTANMQAHLQQRLLTLANCWKITRADGVILGFTDHDRDITVDLQDGDGAIVYEAASGMTASAIQSSGELSVDTQDTVGILKSEVITGNDIRAGRYDNAVVKHFKVNYEDTSTGMGVIKLKRSTIGEMKIAEPFYTAELRSLAQAYSQNIVEVVRPACGVNLGSAKCMVDLNPSEWQVGTAYTERTDRDAGSGSVVKPSVYNDRWFKCVQAGTSGSDEPTWDTTIGNQTVDGDVIWEAQRAWAVDNIEILEVIDNGDFWINYTGDAPDALFTLGLIKMVTGANLNLFREIRQFSTNSDGPVRVQTFLPFPFDLQSIVTSTGPDVCRITAGCGKIRSVCRDTFDNIENYHGFPDVPGSDGLYQTPNAPTG